MQTSADLTEPEFREMVKLKVKVFRGTATKREAARAKTLDLRRIRAADAVGRTAASRLASLSARAGEEVAR